MPRFPKPASSWEIARLYSALKAQAEFDQVKAFVAKWCDEAKTTRLVVASGSNYNDEYYGGEERSVRGVRFDYAKPAWANTLDETSEKERRELSYDLDDFYEYRVSDGSVQAEYQSDVGQLPLGTFDLTKPPPPLAVTIYLVPTKEQSL